MTARYSSRPRRSSGSGSSQETIIAILLLAVIIETFLLVRPYIKKHPQKEPTPAQKITAPKVKPRPKIAAPSLAPETPGPVIPIPAPSYPPGNKAKIAVIIDDSGYSTNDCEHLTAIAQPLTISILPDLEYSRPTAYCAHMEHKEVMLHLPMEPHNNTDRYPEDYIIKTKMNDATILDIVEKSLKNVPHAMGLNNHMGSKATEDRRVMGIVMKDLRKRKLYFIDSLTTSKSVGESVARVEGVPSHHRDVFLDNVNTRSAIEEQFAILAQKARKKGKAIGIGHARSLTWQIVREELEKLSQKGYEIVPVSVLINAAKP